MKRMERIWLRPSYKIGFFCHLSKNLYNEANYIVRQNFFKTGKWVRYNELAYQLKGSENYRQLPAQTGQQILKIVERNWKSFFRSIKTYKKHPEKYKKKPSLPKYKKKDGEFMLVFTNQQCHLRDGFVVFPKKIREALDKIETRIKKGLKEVRVIPKAVGYVLEIIYDKTFKKIKRDKNRVAGVDIGVRNLVAIANNIGEKPIVVKGRTAKNINQYFNYHKSRLQSIYDRQEIKTGYRAKRLFVKRNKKLSDYLHKVSRRVVEYLVDHDIGLLVIGHNDNWKQKSNIGKRNNQNFVSIPFYKLIQMLKYKCEEQSIDVVIQEESHTSVCSFYDGESVEHHEEYVGKRNRGLFRTAKGLVVNSDVNGALNIIKKAVPDAFERLDADRMEDAVSHPSRLEVF